MSENPQAKLRQRALESRRNLTPEQRRLLSKKIASKFVHSAYFLRAQRIGIYLSSFDEVQTEQIILRSWRANKSLFAPVLTSRNTIIFHALTPDTDLGRNRFGIMEPLESNAISARKLDVVLTPLVAFDENANRIGMGGGYYDTCFSFKKNASAWQKPRLIGLAFKCQQIEKIARNPWDISLCKVFTD